MVCGLCQTDPKCDYLSLLNYHPEYPEGHYFEGQCLDILLTKTANTQSFKNLKVAFLTNGP